MAALPELTEEFSSSVLVAATIGFGLGSGWVVVVGVDAARDGWLTLVVFGGLVGFLLLLLLGTAVGGFAADLTRS